MSKPLTIAIALIGLAVATVVVTWLGAGKIWQAILTLGWRGFCWLVLWQLAVFCLLGVAWWIQAASGGIPMMMLRASFWKPGNCAGSHDVKTRDADVPRPGTLSMSSFPP